LGADSLNFCRVTRFEAEIFASAMKNYAHVAFLQSREDRT
jgi:hypothetical protein